MLDPRIPTMTRTSLPTKIDRGIAPIEEWIALLALGVSTVIASAR
jgi:hypothetical protein